MDAPGSEGMTFAARSREGEAALAELIIILEQNGFDVFHVVQETWLPARLHDAVRFVHDDLMVRAIRYFPDLAVVGPGFPWSYWDAKRNVTPGTANFSIEKACYEELMARHAKGERVIVSFKDVDNKWYACWVQMLNPVRDMTGVRGESRSSHTPYLLVRKDNAKRLSDFLRADMP